MKAVPEGAPPREGYPGGFAQWMEDCVSWRLAPPGMSWDEAVAREERNRKQREYVRSKKLRDELKQLLAKAVQQ